MDECIQSYFRSSYLTAEDNTTVVPSHHWFNWFHAGGGFYVQKNSIQFKQNLLTAIQKINISVWRVPCKCLLHHRE